MEEALATLIQGLLKEGTLGVIILGLVYWLWKKDERLNTVQEQRVKDALKIADAAHTFSNALDRNTDTLRAFTED